MDSKTIVEGYLKKSDWRINENSNATASVGAMTKYMAGEISKDYWLREIYNPVDVDISKAYRDGHIHIHDLGSGLTLYCCGYSLKEILQKGVKGVPNIPTSSPARHFDSALAQIANLTTIFQNEIAGAVAFSSVDTLLAPYIGIDKLDYKQVKQALQNFIFAINSNSRAGAEPAFSNITLDLTPPNDLLNKTVIIDGETTPYTYKYFQKEMDMFNRAFCELMLQGDAEGKPFAYPIPTYNIHKRFDWDNPNNELLWKMTGQYGIPYFANYLNSDMKPEDARSMCILPDTRVHIKEVSTGKHREMTISEVFKSYSIDEYLMLTRYGYKPVKEEFELGYEGDMIKVVTESGNTLTTTLDHPWRVYKTDGRGKFHTLLEKRASDLAVGDYVSLRNNKMADLNRERLGKSYEEIYGEDKGKRLRETISEVNKSLGKWSGDDNPAVDMTQDHKDAIGRGLKGHYVSDNCRRLSSERWLGNNNPVFNQEYWDRNHENSAITSKYELIFAEELESLDLDYVHQYVIGGHIVDFYIPSKNLVVELETSYNGCSYDEEDGWKCHHGVSGSERLEELKSLGYHVLIFNPTDGTDTYRQYINRVDKIVSIEIIPYNGYVYDVEIDTDGEYLNAHTFYANDILTGNCCRLRLDMRELTKRGGGLFGSGDSTGSIGVVTINLPRIAYEARKVAIDSRLPDVSDIKIYYNNLSKSIFYSKLDYYMGLAKQSLEIKREYLQHHILEAHLIPAFEEYVGTLNNHFSTIGLIGMNEMCENLLGVSITDKEGKDFSLEVLDYMRDQLSDYQEETGHLYNLEATPAESTAYRLAMKDKEYCTDIKSQGPDDAPYYTNSCHVPVKDITTIKELFDHQDDLQCKFTGGTVVHLYLDGPISGTQAKFIVRSTCENYKLPYISISPLITICPEHGQLNKPHDVCPMCGKETKKLQRITGYIREVKNWNAGKKSEFKDRKQFSL